jgi:hypothetical protein
MSAGEARKGVAAKRNGGILGAFGGPSHASDEAEDEKLPQLTLGDRRPG